MSIFEVVSAIVLIIACIFIVIVVLVKDTKTQMSQTISGSSSDSFYQKNVKLICSHGGLIYGRSYFRLY